MPATLRIIRIVIFLIPIVVLGWLLDRNLAITTPLEAHYDFRQPSALVSFVKPDSRIVPPREENGEYFTTLIDDPAYIEIAYPPMPFKKAYVEVRYRVFDQPIFKLGIRRGVTGSDMELQSVYPESANAEEGTWQWGRAEFDLANAYVNGKHHAVIILSAPEIKKNGGRVDIVEVHVRYEKSLLAD